MNYLKARIKETRIIVDIIGEVCDPWDNGYTICVKKETASPECTYRVRPNMIEYIKEV